MFVGGLETHDVLGDSIHAEPKCLGVGRDLLVEVPDVLYDFRHLVGRGGFEAEVADE